MNLPKRLMVGPHVYTVSYKERLVDAGTHMLGLASHNEENKIELDTLLKTNDTMRGEVFLHEILHVLSRNYNLDLEEEKIKVLAPALLDVIRRNKLDFLFKDARSTK